MDEPQMCFACNERPAASSEKTVPLCEKCASLAKDSRGVKYEPRDPPTQVEPNGASR